MRKVLALASILAALTLTGCGAQGDMNVSDSKPQPVTTGSGETPRWTGTFEKHLPDGRDITCLWVRDTGGVAGLSCDWEDTR